MSTPEPPGPPGLTTNEPTRSRCLVDRARSRAISNVSPAPGPVLAPAPVPQSRGTAMRAHSYRMSGAPRPTSSSGTSGQGRHVGALPVGAAAPSTSVRGANAGSVQPAVSSAAATKAARCRRTRRVVAIRG